MAADCLLVLDLSGRILDINQTGLDQRGYRKEEMVGRKISEFDPPEFADLVPERMAALFRDGQARFESAHICKDGSVLPVEINCRLVELEGHGCVFSVIRDIRLQQQLEADLRRGEAQYRAAIETSADGFWMTDATGRILEVNAAYSQRSGYSRDELLAMRVTDLEASEQPEDVAAHIAKIIAHGSDRFESRHRARDGSLWSVEVTTSYSPLDGGRFYVFVKDITELKQTQAAQKLAALVYQSSSEAMIVTDADNRILAVNPAFTETTGYALEEVAGQLPSVLASGNQSDQFYAELWAELNASGSWRGEIWNRRKSGEVYAEQLTINTIYQPDGSVHRRVALFSDVTEQKKSEEIIWRQANFDVLTGLPNRRMFRDRLDQEMKKSHRTNEPMALLFIDLDRFKEVNDSLGHHVGDQLLVEAAQRLTRCVRETDTVARLGGDEFTVILPQFGEPAHLERIAQDIISKLAEPYLLGSEMVYVSASIGVTVYPNDGVQLEQLLRNADQAMYAAKDHGRNRYSFFTKALQEAAQNRMRLINDLSSALKNGQLEVHFQPIVELCSGRIFKAEALLRWHHPERGLVSPATFIPLAEETGLINEIGDWTFRESARWAKRWSDLSHGAFQISVNKSPVQFRSEIGTLESWQAYLCELGLPGQGVAIEITEGLLLNEDGGTQHKLHLCRDGGMQVSIDDFGTGYSALSYLKKFELDYLKIDQSFVSNMVEDSADLALCEAIVVMAHKLGLKVIAEGVETEQQRAILTRIGCDFGQGYLFARPQAGAALEQLMQRHWALPPVH